MSQISNIRLIATFLALAISANAIAENTNPNGNGASLTEQDRKEVFAKARVWIEGFLQGTEKPDAMLVAATVPILNKSGVLQNRSLTIIDYTNGVYVGRYLELESFPYKITKHVFKHEDAVDWLFDKRSSRLIGVSFSACALIKHEYPERAQEIIEKHKLNCD